jgi:hypothetical protein
MNQYQARLPDPAFATGAFEPIIIRPKPICIVLLLLLVLALPVLGLYRAVNNGDQTGILEIGIFLVPTLLFATNAAWFHYTEFSAYGIRRSHWFGLVNTSVRISDISDVRYVQVSHYAPAISFETPESTTYVNIVLYGTSWVDPVIRHMSSMGVRVEPRLLDSQSNGLLKIRLF